MPIYRKKLSLAKKGADLDGLTAMEQISKLEFGVDGEVGEVGIILSDGLKPVTAGVEAWVEAKNGYIGGVLGYQAPIEFSEAMK